MEILQQMQEDSDDMSSRNTGSERSGTSTSSSVSSKTNSNISSLFNNFKDAVLSKVTAKKQKCNALEAREIYPRMPWHDLQCAVSGLVARDVAAHFVQVQ